MNIEFHQLPEGRWKARLVGCSIAIDCGEGDTKEAAYGDLYANWRVWIGHTERNIDAVFMQTRKELNQEKEQA